MKKILSVIVIFVIANSRSFADVDNNINFDASISHDDNLNKTPNHEFAFDSAFATAGAGYSHNRVINNKSIIDYHLSLKYEDYQDTSGLDNAEIIAGINYHIKPLPGFTKATYILKGNIRVADFETDIRDRTSYETSAIMSFWATNTVSLRTGLTARIQDSDSRVFDTTDYRLFINSDIILNKKSTLYTTLNLLTGDLVSTVDQADVNGNILDIVRQAEDIEFDPTFGDNMVAYRVDTDVAALTIGFNYVIARKQSMDFSVRHAVGKADYGVDYKASFINLSYLVSFRL